MIHLLAQAVPELTLTSALVIYGPMGGMLVWFMLTVTRSIKDLAHRIDGMTRAMLVDVISRDSTGVHARQTAHEMLAKIESRDAGGKRD